MEPRAAPPEPLSVSTATGGIDDEWGRFLEAHPWGRHEQSSRWCAVKEKLGWKVHRAVARQQDKIVGGFQLLHKRKAPLLRIGYISHGPTMVSDQPGLAPLLADTVIAAARRLHLRALALQTPREHDALAHEFRERGFHPNRLQHIIDTTGELDLTQSEEQLLANMRAVRRRNIRNAARGPLRVAEGMRADLPTFFSLMQASCRRQGVSPNPPDVDTLRALWDLYAPTGWMHLLFAELDRRPVCAILSIPFGDRLWSWKIGWSGEYAGLCPNDFLFWECIRRAKEHGCRYFDFVGIDRRMRTIADASGPVAFELAKSAGFYKLGFGPIIVDLPAPLIRFWPGPLHAGYRAWARRLAARSAVG